MLKNKAEIPDTRIQIFKEGEKVYVKAEQKGLYLPILTNKYWGCSKMWSRLYENAAVFISELCFESLLYEVS